MAMALVLLSAIKFYLILVVNPLHFVCCCSLNPNSTLFSSSIALPLLSRPIVASPFRSVAIEKRSNDTRLDFDYNVSLVVPVMLGTPPQQVLMVIDTGSELSWVQCQPCNGCFDFNPLLSTSYSVISCTSAECTTETRDFPSPTTCDAKNNVCDFTYSYADGSSSEGNLGRDTATLGKDLRLPGLVFGCVNSSLLSNSSNGGQLSTGIMGLNLGDLSFIQQLGNLGYPKKFSYCIVDPVEFPSSSGVLVLGESPYSSNSSSLQYTSLLRLSTPLPYFNRAAYTVRLQGIKVADKLLPLPRSMFMPNHTGAGQTMIDSGTQFTFLLGPAYNALKREFVLQTQGRLQPVKDRDFTFEGVLDLCYRLPKLAPIPEIPPVTLVFDSAQVRVSGNQLLYPVNDTSNSHDRVYCFTFGNSDLVPVEANIIGNHHQQNLWVEYDLERSRIGFAPAECNMY